jgi:transketolase
MGDRVSPQHIRRIILEQSRRAHVGHIGPALSVVEIIAALYGRVLRIPGPDALDRDRFVLSKGHAALALYAALFLRGFITGEQLAAYCTDGTMLGVHPEHVLPGVDFSTGSLGHGLAYAVGAVLAARLGGSGRRAYALLSDAECNEGSVWEAAMFAGHHRLGALTAIVDNNGQQALGKTAAILDLEPLAGKWRAFGWQTVEVDGHDLVALGDAIGSPPGDVPRAVIASTVCGRGVSFMEGKVEWHYLPMTEAQYFQALAEIG